MSTAPSQPTEVATCPTRAVVRIGAVMVMAGSSPGTANCRRCSVLEIRPRLCRWRPGRCPVSDGSPVARLTAVVQADALTRHRSRGQHDTDLAASLHRGRHLAPAEKALHQLIRDLLDEAAHAGDVRDDVPAAELAAYCLHALNAAASAGSAAAVQSLVALTCAAIQTR